MTTRTISLITGLLAVAVIRTAWPQRSNEADSFLARKERWAIKTGADDAAGSIDISRPKTAKVVDLIKLARPNQLPENATSRDAQVTRYSQAEKTVYTIDADIIRYKLEKDDHDFHVVIRDHDDTKAEDASIESGARRTMIVEFSDPSVVVQTSPWRNLIAAARRQFTSRLHPGPRFTYKVIHARVTGVGFYDFLHGQSGVAANGIELHPVTKIELLEEGRGGRNNSQPERAQQHLPSDNQANGQVWVNTGSGKYWRPGTRYFGKTKRGEYMSEQEAIKAGYKAAGGQ